MQRLLKGILEGEPGVPAIARPRRHGHEQQDAWQGLPPCQNRKYVAGNQHPVLQRRLLVGSRATRSDSPRALKASAVSKMAIPGAYICSGAISM
jgi:hypothetical protein